MLGNDQGLQAFAKWIAQCRPAQALVYATGRFFDSVVELVETTSLPAPDAVICGVGTEIRLFPSGELVSEWHRHFPPGWDTRRVRELLSSLPNVSVQPSRWQSKFKASFYLENASSDEIDNIFEMLWSESILPTIVYSSSRDLDVLPAGVNKGTAAAFLASAWGLPRHKVMVSGDSANDLALFEQGFQGIVVANAHRELKVLEGPLVYHADRPYAMGVLEGLKHWMSPVASVAEKGGHPTFWTPCRVPCPRLRGHVLRE
ncbi:MAG: HAD-IIB family hydrolase, partial [Phycisphaerae bacterium]|nr:HAD-IIB family hydrolase [Phycisphaerae bacterium]